MTTKSPPALLTHWASCCSSAINFKYLSSLPLATPHPSPAPPNVKMNRSVGYSYPTLPPGYQNTSPPGAPGMQASALQYPDGSKHFHQVKIVWFLSWYYPWCVWVKKSEDWCVLCICGVLLLRFAVPFVQYGRCSLKLMLLLTPCINLEKLGASSFWSFLSLNLLRILLLKLSAAFSMFFFPQVAVVSWSIGLFSWNFKANWRTLSPTEPLYFKSFVANVC